MVNLTERIKEIRAFSGLSQEKFAEQINLSRSTLSLIESNKSIPTYETMSYICKVFNVLPSYFFDEGEIKLEAYIEAGKYASKKGNDGAFDNITSKSHYGNFIRDNFKNELHKNHSELFELYQVLSELPGLVEILDEFVSTIAIQNPGDIAAIDRFKNGLPSNHPVKMEYKVYENQIIEYLKSMSMHEDVIIRFGKALREFLKTMQPINKEIIWPSFD